MAGITPTRLLAAVLALGYFRVRAIDPAHGAIVGDVSHTVATVWSRSDENSTMKASVYECDARVVGEELMKEVDVDSTGDYTGLVDFSGLTPEACYEVEVIFTASSAASSTAADSVPTYATFTTAPLPSVTRAVRFAWGGDVSGQNVCRDATEGFPVTDALNAVEGMDFFLNVGDAIYADGLCKATGLGGNAQVEGDFERASDLENYWAHWRYNLEDADYQAFLSRQPLFMTWDDHEVVDDFGPGFDERGNSPYTPGVSLLPIGMQAFLNYNPIRATTDPTVQLDFYRSVRWGKSVELFILDCRQYRSLPTDEDTTDSPKTMLGETQLAWLKESLTSSTALWRIVVTSVPLSIPTGASDEARDGWANSDGNTGYELELEEILTYMKDGGMDNVVFITADVHFAQVLRYQPFAEDPDFEVHEIVVGPLNAGPFEQMNLDPTFSPESLFYYAPNQNSLSGVYTYEELKPFFNFGVTDVNVEGDITFSIITSENETVYNMTLNSRSDSTSSSTDSTVDPVSVSTSSSFTESTAEPGSGGESFPPSGSPTPGPSMTADSPESDNSDESVGGNDSGASAGASPPVGGLSGLAGALLGVVFLSRLAGRSS